MDLIPVKPLEAAEGQVREVHRTKLAALHEKMKTDPSPATKPIGD